MKSLCVSKIFAPTISACLFLSPLTVGLTQSFAQESDYKVRTQIIVATFNKKKHVVREKYGVRKERYKEVRCEPVIKQDLMEFNSPTDGGVSTFGLGVLGKPIEVVNGLKQDKFFFEMKR